MLFRLLCFRAGTHFTSLTMRSLQRTLYLPWRVFMNIATALSQQKQKWPCCVTCRQTQKISMANIDTIWLTIKLQKTTCWTILGHLLTISKEGILIWYKHYIEYLQKWIKYSGKLLQNISWGMLIYYSPFVREILV